MRYLFLLCIAFFCISGSGQTTDPEAVVVNPMALRVAACTHCHGEQGRAGPDGYYPRLAGKPALYLYNQLKNFKDQRRQYHLMANMLTPLSDAYLWDIAQYFSELKVPYAPPQQRSLDVAALRRGEALSKEGDKSRGIPACTQCHGQQLMGTLPAIPALLGLPRDYLNAQLGGWQSGLRRGHAPDCMADIAKQLSTQDIYAVTLWLSQQAPPSQIGPVQSRLRLTGDMPLVKCGSERSITREVHEHDTKQTFQPSQVQRGSYLARIGNCALCHTAPGGPAYAGGRGIETPFGIVFSSNISPDVKTGIGSWTRDDFWNALHHGKGKDGRLLNPAFPYTSYTRVTREDADALFAFLQTNTTVVRVNKSHALRWPYGTQLALRAWRSVFFDEVDIQTSNGTPMERGGYLVRGLAHCSECHGTRNRWGGLDNNALLAGGVLPGLNWYAPALQAPQGPNRWVVESLRQWLQTGVVAPGSAAAVGGPMAEVIHHSTQYLTDADAHAIATYLTAATAPVKALAPMPRSTTVGADKRAATLYETRCAQCHGKQGEGLKGVIPALAGNPKVVSANSNNLVLSVLYGGFAPSTAANPKPYGMPPFVLELSDADLAVLLSGLRSSWGNAAPALSEFDIHQLRNDANRQ